MPWQLTGQLEVQNLCRNHRGTHPGDALAAVSLPLQPNMATPMRAQVRPRHAALPHTGGERQGNASDLCCMGCCTGPGQPGGR